MKNLNYDDLEHLTLGSIKDISPLIVEVALEKCFYSAGYEVNHEVLSVLMEVVFYELEDLKLNEFILCLKSFRLRNTQKISVPLIIQLFKHRINES